MFLMIFYNQKICIGFYYRLPLQRGPTQFLDSLYFIVCVSIQLLLLTKSVLLSTADQAQEKVTSQSRYQCSHCQKMFTHKVAMLKHSSECILQALVCSKCSFVAQHSAELDKHICTKNSRLQLGQFGKIFDVINLYRQNIFEEIKKNKHMSCQNYIFIVSQVYNPY